MWHACTDVVLIKLDRWVQLRSMRRMNVHGAETVIRMLRLSDSERWASREWEHATRRSHMRCLGVDGDTT